MRSKKQFFIKIFIINIIVITALCLVWISNYLSWNNGIEKLNTNAQQQLDQFIGHLNSRLERFQFIPQLVAKNQTLVELLQDPKNTSRTDLVNRFLEDINDVIGASDTYLMDKQGLTLAASNWRKDKSFVGRNFSFRPYFINALKGNLGRYFALGTTSGKRGYYFAYPITFAAEVIGVMVVKMNLSNIEQHWSNRDIQFIVSDYNGVVFITTQTDWLYRTIKPLSNTKLSTIKQSKQYGNKALTALDFSVQEQLAANQELVHLSANSLTKHYLVLQQKMPEAMWSVRVLSPLDSIKKSQNTLISFLLMIFTLILLIVYLTWQRHKRQLEKARFQQQAQKHLEQEVKLRTSDLSHEIEEHKQTEILLQETQGELIQTAKLAVLGQMSASISHELNNPLAAIRSYTDNARKYLTLNKTKQVDENLGRISDLTERMGKISKQLKVFARKSSGYLEAVLVDAIINSAIDIASPQFKSLPITINTSLVEKDLWVNADKIQLEQVLINLINNAMFAMEESNHGELSISTQILNAHIFIHIDDNGLGIKKDDLAKIFDPFFTTRKSGMGLGLSISARIIDNLRGQLTAINLQPHGARFSIRLNSEQSNHK